MPIFEFHCLDCGKDFETLVLSKSDQIDCPKCHNTHLERLMSSCAFKSGSKFTSTASSNSCTSCSSKSCSTCH
ncbi:MAG: zinc ribbon domain-containing protein [Deltaproteobacteria bacterium]|nr:zinc ribbon domain-containing protein [Deltaproteobacteria bacterium]